jgi:ABC-2 type transport system permease protein
MSSAWSIVARTEYMEGARSRWFIAMTLLVPLMIGGMLFLSVKLTMQATDKPVHVALVDHSDPPIGDIVRTSLEMPHAGKTHFVVDTVANEQAENVALQARVDSGDLDGYLVLPPDTAHGGRALYRGTNASSLAEVARLSAALKGAVIAGRAKALGLKGDEVGALLADVSLDAEQANGSGGKASGDAAFFAGYFASFVLYLGILVYGVTVTRAVIQEKTSRIVELLVACARPWDLMVGKIVGVGALGLTQMGIWIGTVLLLAAFRGPLLSHFGVHGAESFALPNLGAAEVALIFVYFLGGYFLYASLFAAVGAASSSDREAQQAQMPLVLPMVAAFMCFPVITSNPRGAASIGLTLIPFFSPVLMPMRYLLTPLPAWQLAASIGLLVTTTIGTTWVASRIYRVGILMYGKKPGLAEMIRWIRAWIRAS